MALAEVQNEATERLCELMDDSIDGCLAAQAIKGSAGLILEMHCLLRPCATASINTVCAAAAKCQVLTGDISDDCPCMWCGDTSNQATMVLCDCCNACYHPQCAKESEGTRVHSGPWFGNACKGFLVLWGAPDVMKDWALMDYLWTGALPQDPDECDRLVKLGESYRAHEDELQVLLPAAGHHPERWVIVPPLISRA